MNDPKGHWLGRLHGTGEITGDIVGPTTKSDEWDALATGPAIWETSQMSKPALEIEQLTPDERLALIEQLWDSLSDADVPVSASQQQELDNRLEALDREGLVGVPWEEIDRELERRSR